MSVHVHVLPAYGAGIYYSLGRTSSIWGWGMWERLIVQEARKELEMGTKVSWELFIMSRNSLPIPNDPMHSRSVVLFVMYEGSVEIFNDFARLPSCMFV